MTRREELYRLSVLRLAEEVNKLVPELVSKLNDDMAGVGGTPATKSWPDYGQKNIFSNCFCDLVFSGEIVLVDSREEAARLSDR